MVEPSFLADTKTPSSFWPAAEAIEPVSNWSAEAVVAANPTTTRLATLAKSLPRTWVMMCLSWTFYPRKGHTRTTRRTLVGRHLRPTLGGPYFGYSRNCRRAAARKGVAKRRRQQTKPYDFNRHPDFVVVSAPYALVSPEGRARGDLRGDLATLGTPPPDGFDGGHPAEKSGSLANPRYPSVSALFSKPLICTSYPNGSSRWRL